MARFSTLVFAAGLIQQVAATYSIGGCHSDNCARAVTGTRYGNASLAVAKTDCSNFMTSTVTAAPETVFETVTISDLPASTETVVLSSVKVVSTVVATNTLTSTVTVATETNTDHITVTTLSSCTTKICGTTTVKTTTTVTTTSKSGGPGWKRDHRADGLAAANIQPRYATIPAYASPCLDASSYSSACSCWGITSGTVTVPNTAAVTVTISDVETPACVTVTSTNVSTAYAEATGTTLVTQPVTTTTVYVDYITAVASCTVSKTLTVTSTSTVSVPSVPSCTNGPITVTAYRNSAFGSSCGFNVKCASQIVPGNSRCSTSTSSQTSLSNCAIVCGSHSQCDAFAYQPASNSCTIYINLGSYTLKSNPLYIAGIASSSW